MTLISLFLCVMLLQSLVSASLRNLQTFQSQCVEGVTFTAFKTSLSFEAAATECARLDLENESVLAAFRSEAQFNEMVEAARVATGASSFVAFWVGLRAPEESSSDVTSAFQFVSDNQTGLETIVNVGVGVFPWGPGQPNSGTQHCARLDLFEDEIRLDDKACGSTRFFICSSNCEIPVLDPTAAPTPPTSAPTPPSPPTSAPTPPTSAPTPPTSAPTPPTSAPTPPSPPTSAPTPPTSAPTPPTSAPTPPTSAPTPPTSAPTPPTSAPTPPTSAPTPPTSAPTPPTSAPTPPTSAPTPPTSAPTPPTSAPTPPTSAPTPPTSAPTPPTSAPTPPTSAPTPPTSAPTPPTSAPTPPTSAPTPPTSAPTPPTSAPTPPTSAPTPPTSAPTPPTSAPTPPTSAPTPPTSAPTPPTSAPQPNGDVVPTSFPTSEGDSNAGISLAVIAGIILPLVLFGAIFLVLVMKQKKNNSTNRISKEAKPIEEEKVDAKKNLSNSTIERVEKELAEEMEFEALFANKGKSVNVVEVSKADEAEFDAIVSGTKRRQQPMGKTIQSDNPGYKQGDTAVAPISANARPQSAYLKSVETNPYRRSIFRPSSLFLSKAKRDKAMKQTATDNLDIDDDI